MDNIRDIAKRLIEIMKDDDKFEARFDKNPAKAIEDVLGIDLPDDIMEKVVAGVKAKISIDDLSDAVGLLKKLF